jgi:(5-formylfuran-3-yl)methyl phosphate synthase
MRLLISVASATDAAAALAGGADVIDAKDAQAGALGPVAPAVLRDIRALVAGARPVTAALGDADDEATIECAASTYAAAGATLVKVGFAGVSSGDRAAALTAAAVRGAKAAGSGVVAVAYADAVRASSPAAATLVDVAARTGAEGLLIDTWDKNGPGLPGLIALSALSALVAEAHSAGLFVALAGKLTADDFPFVRNAGADVAGVRGAACDGGRTGRITADRVRVLRDLCGPDAACFELMPQRALNGWHRVL